MPRILLIERSARHEGSVSRQPTAEFVALRRQEHPQDEIAMREQLAAQARADLPRCVSRGKQFFHGRLRAAVF